MTEQKTYWVIKIHKHYIKFIPSGSSVVSDINTASGYEREFICKWVINRIQDEFRTELIPVKVTRTTKEI